MNIKTNLVEDFVDCVDNTAKQNTYFKIVIALFVIIISLFLICFT